MAETPGWPYGNTGKARLTSGGWQKEQYLSLLKITAIRRFFWGDEVRTYCLWQQLNGVLLPSRKETPESTLSQPLANEIFENTGLEKDSFGPA